MCSKVAGGSGGREGERRGKEEEGGWLMRIESWGRFSVYVARIRNFGAPEPTSNIPPFFPLSRSARTHRHVCVDTHRHEDGASRFGEKKWIRIFDLQFRGS